ncbi:MAG TPA: polysaccharide biosynthesis/export family protein [Vicinamibacterales bacterium]|nr:polysaccharide biosynthesis/export family protein [Vicinamibacterales bacterium]
MPPLLGQTLAPNAQNDYVIGTQDVVNITVFDQPEFSGKFTVAADGTAMFPYIGRVEVAGLTLRELERQLKAKLADGFVRNPQVTASLDQFRGRRVFIFGAVSGPGMYPLGDYTTLIEALAKAGYNAASEAVIVRVPGAKGPVMPEEASAGQVIRVNLREFEKEVESGQLSRNVILEDGDTIYVPRVDRNRVFVSGEVRTPGAYSVPEGTTVLQAVTLAGGFTERAATGRIQISRLVDGSQKKLKAALGDVVQPGDTIIVPERYF